MSGADLTNDELLLDEDLSALIDGELAPARAAELRERVRVDPILSARLRELERVSEMLVALPVVAPSQQLGDALRVRIAAERAGRRRRRAVQVGALAAAASLATAAASLAIYFFAVARPGSTPAPGNVREPIAGLAAPDSLEQATDEEIGIVLDYETLAGLDGLEELDVIEQLDLLERMAARAANAKGKRG